MATHLCSRRMRASHCRPSMSSQEGAKQRIFNAELHLLADLLASSPCESRFGEL